MRGNKLNKYGIFRKRKMLATDKPVVFLDLEIGAESGQILDIGAVRSDGEKLHSPSKRDLQRFLPGTGYICGHNIVNHDLKYLENILSKTLDLRAIDTLYLSPLLFPERLSHALFKDEKLQDGEWNNPVNDCRKAEKLFRDEINAFFLLPSDIRRIFAALLYDHEEFKGFFQYIDFIPSDQDTETLIKSVFSGKICENSDLQRLILEYPVELAYALALINCGDRIAIPSWVVNTYPETGHMMEMLCNMPCEAGCDYCRQHFNVRKELKKIFGYDGFRTYGGKALQEEAVRAAVDGKSLLAVFPTGGGKSLTFQLPALMAGNTVHGLTVVISPLQSLMKDQVDNLNAQGVVEAVTINGLLNEIERADAFRRIGDGLAVLLYISPEQLRSRTIERLLISRNVVRFVIDEAHCFSAWGQDFRVDYLYIGDFIKRLMKEKGSKSVIPVSCFTATAKQKVISDICDYFRKKLNLDIKVFAAEATRENLRYKVIHEETDAEKYNTLRNLISAKDCPTIVYVSRTRQTREIAQKLTADGFPACPFNGQMDPEEKVKNQDSFIRNEINIIVATSAFGMGVDKKDVGLVIHYDISGSLEDYIQEAGRAGRDPSMEADCFVLYNDNDLDNHFSMLNRSKLSINEIQQVWKAIKDMTGVRKHVCCSPLEIARQAGWDDSVREIETRVKTAISALENAGYVKRERNMPQVYATSISVNNMAEAVNRINASPLFSERQRVDAKRIISSLISSKYISKASGDEGESRVDYMADMLGIERKDVINAINLMRQEGLLNDERDMSAYIFDTDTEKRSKMILDRFSKLEKFMLSQSAEEWHTLNFKELNEDAQADGLKTSSVKNIRTILYYHIINNYVQKRMDQDTGITEFSATMPTAQLLERYSRRIDICRFIIDFLYKKTGDEIIGYGRDGKKVLFSIVELYKEYNDIPRIDTYKEKIALKDVEDALLYLSKIGALRLEGGFLVLYNRMEIKRLVVDNRIKYKVDDYRFLDDFYKHKIQHIHIVGEYANMMVRDYNAALQFVHDYFQMDFKKFIAKYFKGERVNEINRNITLKKYNRIFGELSDTQLNIINDTESKYIVVAAGPGSGKTRVLVHKLASLLMLEDVKNEQLLMLTFSRAAAVEFKKRLISLIGRAAYFVEIKTFHSYCFDLIGKTGNLEDIKDVVKNAAVMIERGEVEQGKITKNVLVIDEAQDMDENEFRLLEALMRKNDDMRVIAVGDDDQNIYQFRGSDSKYLRSLIDEHGAVKYEMTENHRSKADIVKLSNAFAGLISHRMKESAVRAVRQERGNVVIVQHCCSFMEEPLVHDIVDRHSSGRVCVLTNTNDEALRIMGLLKRQGVRTKLIQSLDDSVSLYNLVEVRYFLKVIDRNLQTPAIPDAVWEEAKMSLMRVYSESECLENCKNMIRDFEMVYPMKYRNDLEEFIRQSRYEDFYDDKREAVYVSTIHKSKGREFDVVYMMLKGISVITDEEKRKIYVGMTRAKDELYIHCDTGMFKDMIPDGIEYTVDREMYTESGEVTIQLGYRDVVLDFFKGRKRDIFRMRSGNELFVSGDHIYADIDGRRIKVVKFSKGFRERLEKLYNKGYHLVSSKVRFIVAWKGKADEEETAVLLPDISFRR